MESTVLDGERFDRFVERYDALRGEKSLDWPEQMRQAWMAFELQPLIKTCRRAVILAEAGSGKCTVCWSVPSKLSSARMHPLEAALLPALLNTCDSYILARGKATGLTCIFHFTPD